MSNGCACVTCTCCSLPFSNLNDSEFYKLFYALEYNTIGNINKLDLFSLPKAKYQARYLSPKQIGHIHCNKSKSLTYFHFNVRSLQKNEHKLDDFFLMANLTPSFIAISETQLKAASFCNIEIPGYTFIHNPSSTNAAGVGLYIQSNISHRNDLELKVEGCESLFIEVKSQLKKACIIGVIYRHPSKKIQNFQT